MSSIYQYIYTSMYTGCSEVKREIFVSGSVEYVKLSKKTLNYFAEFAKVNELLIIEDPYRRARQNRTASARR